jgi:hypothetical protein
MIRSGGAVSDNAAAAELRKNPRRSTANMGVPSICPSCRRTIGKLGGARPACFLGLHHALSSCYSVAARVFWRIAKMSLDSISNIFGGVNPKIVLGENPQWELCADLGLARDRFFNAQLG